MVDLRGPIGLASLRASGLAGTRQEDLYGTEDTQPLRASDRLQQRINQRRQEMRGLRLQPQLGKPETISSPPATELPQPMSMPAPQDGAVISAATKLSQPVIGAVGGLGNLLDLPGSMVRDALTFNNPFDQLLSPTSAENRVTGEEMLEQYGLYDDDPNAQRGLGKTVGRFAGGLLTEILLDPLTYVLPGLTAAKAAKTSGGVASRTLSKMGLIDDSAFAVNKRLTDAAFQKTGRRMGKHEAMHHVSAEDVIASRKSEYSQRMGDAEFNQKVLDEIADNSDKFNDQIARDMGDAVGADAIRKIREAKLQDKAYTFKLPGTDRFTKEFNLPFVDPIAHARFRDRVGSNIRWGKYSPVYKLAPIFSKPVRGQKTKQGQQAALEMADELLEAQAAARGMLYNANVTIADSGVLGMPTKNMSDEAKLAMNQRQADMSNAMYDYLEDIGAPRYKQVVTRRKNGSIKVEKTFDSNNEFVTKSYKNEAELEAADPEAYQDFVDIPRSKNSIESVQVDPAQREAWKKSLIENDPRIAELNSLGLIESLDEIKAALDLSLKTARKNGVDLSQFRDPYASYASRISIGVKSGNPLTRAAAVRSNDPNTEFAIARSETRRNIPGGTAALQRMSRETREVGGFAGVNTKQGGMTPERWKVEGDKLFREFQNKPEYQPYIANLDEKLQRQLFEEIAAHDYNMARVGDGFYKNNPAEAALRSVSSVFESTARARGLREFLRNNTVASAGEGLERLITRARNVFGDEDVAGTGSTAMEITGNAIGDIFIDNLRFLRKVDIVDQRGLDLGDTVDPRLEPIPPRVDPVDTSDPIRYGDEPDLNPKGNTEPAPRDPSGDDVADFDTDGAITSEEVDDIVDALEDEAVETASRNAASEGRELSEAEVQQVKQGAREVEVSELDEARKTVEDATSRIRVLEERGFENLAPKLALLQRSADAGNVRDKDILEFFDVRLQVNKPKLHKKKDEIFKRGLDRIRKQEAKAAREQAKDAKGSKGTSSGKAKKKKLNIDESAIRVNEALDGRFGDEPMSLTKLTAEDLADLSPALATIQKSKTANAIYRTFKNVLDMDVSKEVQDQAAKIIRSRRGDTGSPSGVVDSAAPASAPASAPKKTKKKLMKVHEAQSKVGIVLNVDPKFGRPGRLENFTDDDLVELTPALQVLRGSKAKKSKDLYARFMRALERDAPEAQAKARERLRRDLDSGQPAGTEAAKQAQKKADAQIITDEIRDKIRGYIKNPGDLTDEIVKDLSPSLKAMRGTQDNDLVVAFAKALKTRPKLFGKAEARMRSQASPSQAKAGVVDQPKASTAPKQPTAVRTIEEAQEKYKDYSLIRDRFIQDENGTVRLLRRTDEGGSLDRTSALRNLLNRREVQININHRKGRHWDGNMLLREAKARIDGTWDEQYASTARRAVRDAIENRQKYIENEKQRMFLKRSVDILLDTGLNSDAVLAESIIASDWTKGFGRFFSRHRHREIAKNRVRARFLPELVQVYEYADELVDKAAMYGGVDEIPFAGEDGLSFLRASGVWDEAKVVDDPSGAADLAMVMKRLSIESTGNLEDDVIKLRQNVRSWYFEQQERIELQKRKARTKNKTAKDDAERRYESWERKQATIAGKRGAAWSRPRPLEVSRVVVFDSKGRFEDGANANFLPMPSLDGLAEQLVNNVKVQNYQRLFDDDSITEVRNFVPASGPKPGVGYLKPLLDEKLAELDDLMARHSKKTTIGKNIRSKEFKELLARYQKLSKTPRGEPRRSFTMSAASGNKGLIKRLLGKMGYKVDHVEGASTTARSLAYNVFKDSQVPKWLSDAAEDLKFAHKFNDEARLKNVPQDVADFIYQNMGRLNLKFLDMFNPADFPPAATGEFAGEAITYVPDALRRKLSIEPEMPNRMIAGESRQVGKLTDLSNLEVTDPRYAEALASKSKGNRALDAAMEADDSQASFGLRDLTSISVGSAADLDRIARRSGTVLTDQGTSDIDVFDLMDGMRDENGELLDFSDAVIAKARDPEAFDGGIRQAEELRTAEEIAEDADADAFLASEGFDPTGEALESPLPVQGDTARPLGIVDNPERAKEVEQVLSVAKDSKKLTKKKLNELAPFVRTLLDSDNPADKAVVDQYYRSVEKRKTLSKQDPNRDVRQSGGEALDDPDGMTGSSARMDQPAYSTDELYSYVDESLNTGNSKMGLLAIHLDIGATDYSPVLNSASEDFAALVRERKAPYETYEDYLSSNDPALAPLKRALEQNNYMPTVLAGARQQDRAIESLNRIALDSGSDAPIRELLSVYGIEAPSGLDLTSPRGYTYLKSISRSLAVDGQRGTAEIVASASNPLNDVAGDMLGSLESDDYMYPLMIMDAAKRLTGKDYLSESGVDTVAELLEVDNFVFGQAIQDLRRVADNWGNNGLDYGSRQDKKAVFYQATEQESILTEGIEEIEPLTRSMAYLNRMEDDAILHQEQLAWLSDNANVTPEEADFLRLGDIIAEGTRSGNRITAGELKSVIRERTPRIQIVDMSSTGRNIYAGYSVQIGDPSTYSEIIIRSPRGLREPGVDIQNKHFMQKNLIDPRDQSLQRSISPQVDPTTNVLVHLRVNEYTNSEGKKILLIQEVQSDFVQEMRKQVSEASRRMEVANWRYGLTAEDLERFDPLEKELDDIYQDMLASQHLPDEYRSSALRYTEVQQEMQRLTDELYIELRERSPELRLEPSQFREDVPDFFKGAGMFPDESRIINSSDRNKFQLDIEKITALRQKAKNPIFNPRKTTYTDWGMKVAARMAADRGYDGIALIDGASIAVANGASRGSDSFKGIVSHHQVMAKNFQKYMRKSADQHGGGAAPDYAGVSRTISREPVKASNMRLQLYSTTPTPFGTEKMWRAGTFRPISHKDDFHPTGNVWISHNDEMDVYDVMTDIFPEQFSDGNSGRSVVSVKTIDEAKEAAAEIINGGGTRVAYEDFVPGLQSSEVIEFPLDDVTRQNVKGHTMYQGTESGANASIQFPGDIVDPQDWMQSQYKTLIVAYKQADPYSFVHEMGHLLRVSLRQIDPAYLRRAEEMLGIEQAGGKVDAWRKQVLNPRTGEQQSAEEFFADEFMEWVRGGGKPKNDGWDGMWNKFKEFIGSVHRRFAQGKEVENNLSKEMHQFFDDLVGEQLYTEARGDNLTSVLDKMKYTSVRALNAIQDMLDQDDLIEAERNVIFRRLEKQRADLVGSLERRGMANAESQVPDIGNFVDEAMSKLQAERAAGNATPSKVVVGRDISEMEVNTSVSQKELLAQFRMDPEVAKDVVRVHGISQELRDESLMNPYMDIYDAMTNTFKSNVTTIWPSFHFRNFMSGAFQNALNDIFDPTVKGPLKRYIQPYKDSASVLVGDTVQGLEKVPALRKFGDDTTPEQATEELRKLAFRYGVFDSPGQHRELYGLAGPTASIPGMQKMEGDTLTKRLMSYIKTNAESIRDRAPAGQLGKKTDNINPLKVAGGFGAGETDEFFLARYGRPAGDLIEGTHRLGAFMSLLKQGYAPAEASKRVRLLHVDYSDLTSTERNVIRRIFPFYSFSKGMSKYLANEVSTRPGGKVSQTVRSANRSRDKDVSTPEYISQGVSIPLGTDEDGSKNYLTGIGLMHESVLPLFDAGVSVMRVGPQKPLFEFASMTNPVIKGLVETTTNRSLFQEDPRGGRLLADMDPPIGRTLSNVGRGLGLTDSDQPVATPQLLETIASNSPASKLVSTARQLTDTRKGALTKAANTLTGFKFTKVSPQAQDQILRERLSLISNQIGGRTFERDYIPQDVLESMPPELRQQAEVIQSAQARLAERAKQRKAILEMQQAQENN